MNILVLQETDWITRGPHIQHHIFERLSKNPSIKITVIDYDIDNLQRGKSLFLKRKVFESIDRTTKNSKVKIIRTAHIKVPYFRRISSLVTNFFEILRIIRKKRPDLIIGYSITNGLIGLFLAKVLKIPYIFHYIDFLHKLVLLEFAQDFARVVSRLSLKYAEQVIVYTKFQKKYAINEGTPPKRVKILPNCISLENTIVDGEKLNKLKLKYSITDDDFVIFFMGWFYDFAGLKEIIDYYNNDVENGKINLKFIIVGDGGIYNYLVKYVSDIKADWVIFTGRVPFFDVTEYIELADLCLISFKINDITKDITPIKVLEYMAMKKPVLSNSLPGLIFEIGKNNGVIYAKNQTELIKMIAELIPKREELKKEGLKGFELIKKKYVWSKILNDMKKMMIDVIKKKRKKNYIQSNK